LGCGVYGRFVTGTCIQDIKYQFCPKSRSGIREACDGASSSRRLAVVDGSSASGLKSSISVISMRHGRRVASSITTFSWINGVCPNRSYFSARVASVRWPARFRQLGQASRCHEPRSILANSDRTKSWAMHGMFGPSELMPTGRRRTFSVGTKDTRPAAYPLSMLLGIS
jgi:hypothetical protein